MDNLAEQFCTVTGTSDLEVAKNYLQACNGNLNSAISMHMDNSEGSCTNPRSSQEALPDNGTVRAPIPQKQEVLVEHDGYLLANQRKRKRTSNPNSVFDKFRDFQAEAREQESLLKMGAKQAAPSAHLMRLEDLFRPPLDIIHHGSLISAQAKGKMENKWVLVNLQNTSEFSCQVLNRDIWKDPNIREIVTKHFILWQVYHDSVEGQKYMQFYPVTSWPYVSIVHPVTAELLKHWSSLELKSFQESLQDFILLHSKPDGTDASSLAAATNSPAKLIDPVVDASEDSQMEAAIKASLEDKKRVETQQLVFESDGDSCDSLDNDTDTEDEETVSKRKCLQSGANTKKTSQSSIISNNGVTLSSDLPASTSSKCSHPTSSWTDHISQQGTDINILFKKPDMSRCQWTVKSQSTIRALILYVDSLGFPPDAYEIVANFPSRNISSNPHDKTFEDCNFQKQETFYIRKL